MKKRLNYVRMTVTLSYWFTLSMTLGGFFFPLPSVPVIDLVQINSDTCWWRLALLSWRFLDSLLWRKTSWFTFRGKIYNRPLQMLVLFHHAPRVWATSHSLSFSTGNIKLGQCRVLFWNSRFHLCNPGNSWGCDKEESSFSVFVSHGFIILQ